MTDTLFFNKVKMKRESEGDRGKGSRENEGNKTYDIISNEGNKTIIFPFCAGHQSIIKRTSCLQQDRICCGLLPLKRFQHMALRASL
jgi:hypothetical protein